MLKAQHTPQKVLDKLQQQLAYNIAGTKSP
jgi:hypothetical protein